MAEWRPLASLARDARQPGSCRSFVRSPWIRPVRPSSTYGFAAGSQMAFRRSTGGIAARISQMVEAKTCSDRGDGGAVGASQELFACRSQAEPSPVFEWGNGHERPKVLLKRSFGYAAMGDEVRHCNFAAHTLPHELHSLLHVTRNRATLRSPFSSFTSSKVRLSWSLMASHRKRSRQVRPSRRCPTKSTTSGTRAQPSPLKP